jgi:phosphoribosylamine--glycine ligase
MEVNWSNEFACCVVIAAKEYPENPEKGASITVLPFGPTDSVIFHAGTTMEGDNLVVSGGRVLGIAAKGRSLHEALEKAYEKIAQIDFSGKQYRKDIGASVL